MSVTQRNRGKGKWVGVVAVFGGSLSDLRTGQRYELGLKDFAGEYSAYVF